MSVSEYVSVNGYNVLVAKLDINDELNRIKLGTKGGTQFLINRVK